MRKGKVNEMARKQKAATYLKQGMTPRLAWSKAAIEHPRKGN